MVRVLWLALFVLASCSTVNLQLKEKTKIETLGIFFEADPRILSQLTTGLNREIDDFILAHNASGSRKFNLVRTTDAEHSTLKIKILTTQLVTKSQQATGAVVSLIGLSLPIIMGVSGAEFYIFFYYFPRVNSMVELSLSQDINKPGQSPIMRPYASPGFLKSTEKQIDKHVIKFDVFMRQLIREVEKAQARN